MSLFIFRRDLRIQDNIGFNQACQTGEPVYPIFILNPEQIDSTKNPYFSHNSVQFMCESLHDLNRELNQHLSLYHGNIEDVLTEIFKTGHIQRVFFNLDHTGYSQRRDAGIIALAAKYHIECITPDDVGVLPVGTVKTSTGLIYSKFTPFYEKIRVKKVPKPLPTLSVAKCHLAQLHLKKYNYAIRKLDAFYHVNPHILVHGGRKEGLLRLKEMKHTVNHYNKTHDYPIYSTTHLSAYLKYGCISAREAYYLMKTLNKSAADPLIRQLFWRDFYLGIARQHPEIMKGKPLKPSYANIKWQGTASQLNRWKKGVTGFPIVDAGMREMNTTGYMHNRSRLITSGFLIKTLLCNWRDGEKYFAQSLVDYDFANNNGGWQWSSGSGADSQPYFRILNPWIQGTKVDPDAEYIKKWIPELRDVAVKDIHNWDTAYTKYPHLKSHYPAPCVDYTKQKELALKMYNEVFR